MTTVPPAEDNYDDDDTSDYADYFNYDGDDSHADDFVD